MKYYIFRETLDDGRQLEPVAVKSESLETANSAFDAHQHPTPTSKIELRERGVEEFEHYYRALQPNQPHSVFGLEHE